jgi:flagellar hook-associated protein 2
MSTVSSTSSSSTSTSSTTTSSSTKASTGYSVLSSSKSGTGIDYSVLIDAKVQQKLKAATKLETKVTNNENKITAYQTLQTKLQTADTGIAGLRNRSTALGSTATNLFDERSAYLTGTNASDTLGATVADGTTKGTYAIVVEQLATKNKIAGSTQSSSSTALGYTGSFTLGVSGGTTSSISVDSTDTLTTLAAKINAVSSTTNVSASVLQVSGSSYELVLTSASTGQTITVTDGGDGVTTSLGLTDSSGAIANTLVAGQDAKFTVDGVEMTRSSNTVTDAISGVTLNLYSASTNTISMEISNNLTDIKSAITNFVTNYNDLKSTITTETATNSDGSAADGAYLVRDTYMSEIGNALTSIMGTSITNSSGSVLSLSTLGITLASDGTLSYDETTLNKELSNNLDDVQKLLGLSVTTSSDSMQLLRYNSQSTSMSLTLDMEMNSDGTIASASVNGDNSLFTVSGNTITGATGSQYEGLVLVYSGSSGSVSVNVQQGIADQFYSQMDKYANSKTGSLATAITDLTEENTTYQTKISDIQDRADSYRTKLTSYYAKLEAKAEAARSLLKQIKASMGLKTSSS